MSFNPFSKSISEIKATDLKGLREVSEGWYVDYKREGIAIKDYAKHISAFANQHGGWIFIGINECIELVTAGEFSGIPSSKVSSEITKIREAVSAHCSPSPTYDLKVIKGPCKTIGLPAKRSIIMIQIPRGINTPHIHSSGKIYRRIGDQSKPETDRYELNDLYLRAERQNKLFEQELKRLPFLFNPKQPRAYLYLFQDPFQQTKISDLNYEKFREILCTPSPQLSTFIPFDNSQSTQNGFIARQVANNEPSSDVISFRWYSNGNATIEIPLNKFHQGESDQHLYVHESGRKFHNLLRSSRHHSSFIIDFSLLLASMTAAITQYGAILKAINTESKYFLKARLMNIGGLLPFFPSDRYLEQIEKFGAPIIMDDELWIPHGTSIESLMEGRMLQDDPSPAGFVLSSFVLHVCGILPTFGLDELTDLVISSSKAAALTKINKEERK